MKKLISNEHSMNSKEIVALSMLKLYFTSDETEMRKQWKQRVMKCKNEEILIDGNSLLTLLESAKCYAVTVLEEKKEDFMEIMNGIDKSIKNAEKQKNADIRQLEEVKQLQNQYNAFVEDILNLPELNMVGIRLNVFGRDVFSTEKSIAHSRKKVTPDNISKAPDWLDFSQDLFERYVEWGEVKKNKIVYHMTFGVTLAAYNIKRGIRDYIGYRYVKNDGTIGCIRNTQVLYDELLRRNS